eukprot:m.164983 g.164983  ORF g.164983 m.164983 type:complete len:64 (-) comp14415_c0_seq2:2374-2565(-)
MIRFHNERSCQESAIMSVLPTGRLLIPPPPLHFASLLVLSDGFIAGEETEQQQTLNNQGLIHT